MNALEIEKTAADWLVKRTSGTWSSQEQAELNAWVEASLAHRIAYLRIEAVWNQTGRLQALAAGAAPNAVPPRGAWLDTGSLPIAHPPAKPSEGEIAVRSVWKRNRVAALAASFMVLFAAAGAVGYVLWPLGGRYATSVGGMETVPLDDGSQITLNTDTRLRVAINPAQRLIELDKGEAYFEVAKDPARPFIVAAGGKRVIAVGTRFSVRRHVNDIEVIVTEGSVRIEEEQKLPDTAKLISAGAIARTRHGTVVVENEPPAQIENHLSWRSGYLVFRDTPLAEAVAEFNRYNDRKIVIEDPAIAAMQVGGNFKSDSTDVFLWMLRNGFPVEVDQKGEDIVLKAR
jgi:transmembrane sensor